MHSENALDLRDDELGVPALGVLALDERMGVACLFADRGDDGGMSFLSLSVIFGEREVEGLFHIRFGRLSTTGTALSSFPLERRDPKTENRRCKAPRTPG